MAIIDEAWHGKPVSVPVIDAHSHILEYYNSGWYQSFVTTEDVISIMDHLGINCIVTAPHSLIMGNMEDANRIAAQAADRFSGRIYAYISVIPHEGLTSVKSELNKHSKNPKFIGLKLLAGYHGNLSSTEYQYAFDFAKDTGCPALCHIWDNSPPLKEVENAVKSRPHLKLMMAHQGGGGTDNTDEYVKLMNTYPNLYMEICGSFLNQYSIEELVGFACENRVIYGSDQINLDPRYDFGKVVFSTLDDVIKKKILAGNFLSLINGSSMGQISLGSS